MMSNLLSRFPLIALSCLLLIGATGMALAQETITTEIKKGEVVSVYGNHLVVLGALLLLALGAGLTVLRRLTH